MELEKCACVTTKLVTLSVLIAGTAAAQTTTARRGSSENLANYADEWGQLDGQVSYDLMAGRMQAFLSAQNILDEVVKPHTTGALPLGWSKYGTRLSLGLTHKFG